ncbi:MAG: Do family serine endopeptidase [Pyrinomonadaceae bacterium]
MKSLKFNAYKSRMIVLSSRYCVTFLWALLLSYGFVFAQTTENFKKTKSVLVAPERLSGSFAEVAAMVEPAVVNIDTKGRIDDPTLAGKRSGGDENPFDDFLRKLPRPSYAVGSGFLIDPRGYVVTNLHVVEDSAAITVRLRSGEEYDAKIVGADEMTDLAVLKINGDKEFPYLTFGDSDKISIGEWVLAIGSPFGLEQTVTAGIISQTNRETPAGTGFQKFIQTDAAINRGNSGGPLVNMRGEVIGVNSQIATSTGDYNGIGFALPSKEASAVYNQILEYGKVKRGYLGIHLESVKKEFAAVYGLPNATGAIVTEIRDKNSAAAKAGLKKEDIVVAVNGEPVENHQDLIAKIAGMLPGSTARLTIYREKGDQLEKLFIDVVLDVRKGEDYVPNDETRKRLSLSAQAKQAFSGLSVEPLDKMMSRRFNRQEEGGVIIVNVNPASYLADIKATNGDDALKSGDLIVKINRMPVTTVAEFNRISQQYTAGMPVVMHILRYDSDNRLVFPMIVQFTAK